jgi:LysR family glycine cleavage system transcriptional activator
MKTPVYLNALRAFEASARHQSFLRLRPSWNVTPAAVGQLVRTLEEWLGTAVSSCRRWAGKAGAQRGGGTRLAGYSCRFRRLSLGLERLREGSLNGVLTVTVSPAFAAKWLLPRIDRFQSACPDTDVRLDTNLKAVDLPPSASISACATDWEAGPD